MEKKHKNRIILLTGKGKGKTSSALGMVLRAVGHNLRVSVIQFVKSCSNTGEARALQRLPGVEHLVCGKGFVTPSDTPEKIDQHCRSAAEGLILARQRMENPEIRMVVLDEICSTINLNLLSEKDIQELIASASDGKIIILTGRNAPQSLMDISDTVSAIEEVKHGLQHGIVAQPGVEF
ncbi:MAG: cob(I)yrinic acid a,c-diamide adenosyltransferase [bacterium]